MITLRKANERGHTQIGWLDSKHSFSFGEYYEPGFMGFGPLRVINEDKVSPGAGFGRHHHDNMEIISYVLEGALAHKDSLGNGSVIGPGDVQRISAGRGIEHSEFNPSDDEPVHFLQIWIIPETRGITPGYEQKNFTDGHPHKGLQLIGSKDGRENSVTIHQDVNLHLGRLPQSEELSLTIAHGRIVWVQVLKGAVALNGHELAEGDGAAVTEETALVVLSAATNSEFLVFDMGR